MTLVSPPELAREFPGPHASRSVTRAPWRRRNNAVQPPNAPAPTTTMSGCLGLGTQPPRAAATATPDLRNTRRSNVRPPRAPRGALFPAPPPATRDPTDRRRRLRESHHRRQAPRASGGYSPPPVP